MSESQVWNPLPTRHHRDESQTLRGGVWQQRISSAACADRR